MKVNTNSLCNSCKHFWHECGVPELDYECEETCSSENEQTREEFESEFEIMDCNDFKSK